MKLSARNLFEVVKTAGKDWMNDKAPRLGAALSFYTLFSLSPLLVLLVSIAGLWTSGNANNEVFTQIGTIIGQDNAESLQKMLNQPGKEHHGIFASIIAGVMLFIGATVVFSQLQDALNQIWEVEQKPGQGIMGFVRHRLLSFTMVLGIAFLLLISLIVSAALSAAGSYLEQWFGNSTWLLHTLNLAISFGVFTFLFALMFKYIPDAKVDWKDVWFGATVTTVLFIVGKYLLALYIGKSSLVSTYAAASSLIVVLLWVYYSSQILFFGAELTQAYAHASGRDVQPSEHAQWSAEKRCKREAAEKRREEKKSTTKKEPSPFPQEVDPGWQTSPALGGVGFETGRGNIQHYFRRHLRFKSMMGMAMLAVALWPIKKHLRTFHRLRR